VGWRAGDGTAAGSQSVPLGSLLVLARPWPCSWGHRASSLPNAEHQTTCALPPSAWPGIMRRQPSLSGQLARPALLASTPRPNPRACPAAELRGGPSRSKQARHWNYPDLGLESDPALLGQLRNLDALPALRAFLQEWVPAAWPRVARQLGLAPDDNRAGSAAGQQAPRRSEEDAGRAAEGDNLAAPAPAPAPAVAGRAHLGTGIGQEGCLPWGLKRVSGLRLGHAVPQKLSCAVGGCLG
jgi:hypothetical protein